MTGRVEMRSVPDKEIIRRIIRVNIRAVKVCYEKGLASDPKLEGRVVIHFVIAPSGRVTTSEVQKSTLNNSAVGSCIARAVRRWRFPKPKGGGAVDVSYPFVLRTP
jgi:TonB family protein